MARRPPFYAAGTLDMKKKIVRVILLVAVVAAAGVWLVQSRGNERSRPGIFVSGNIEATEVDLSFRISGQIKQFPVEEGDRVKTDQLIAELDTDTLLALKGAAQAEIAAGEAQLDELVRGSRAEEIEMARALFAGAESRLANAKSEHQRHVGLLKEGAVSASSFDAKDMVLKVAKAEVDNARERLREVETGPREERIRTAKARLERARWDLNKIELDLKHSEIKSVVDGVVLVKSNEVGEVVLPGATIATVAAVDQVWLKGYVGEQYLARLRLGQIVDVTTDTFPNKKYRGRITFISPRAEFTPKNVQTREERIKQVYRVKATIPNPDYELKIGMPAEGFIIEETPPAGQETAENGKQGLAAKLSAWARGLGTRLGMF
jgi:HlyD family secretion protein